jgi:hypothetical protein
LKSRRSTKKIVGISPAWNLKDLPRDGKLNIESIHDWLAEVAPKEEKKYDGRHNKRTCIKRDLSLFMA